MAVSAVAQRLSNNLISKAAQSVGRKVLFGDHFAFCYFWVNTGGEEYTR